MAPTTGTKETRSLEAILKNRPDSLLFARLADAYRKDGNIGRAIELCANGLSNFPYYTTGRLLLGRCYLEQQKYSEAIEAFTMVCTGDRRNQMAIKMLADIFVKQGMEQRAGGLYALLLQMDPVNKTLAHLCAKYGANSGEGDLFTLLGIEPAAAELPRMNTGRAETPFADSFEPAPPQEVPDHTMVEDRDVLFPDMGTANTMQQFSAGPEVDEQYSAAGFSGGDISDRMSALFDEQQPFEASETSAPSSIPDDTPAKNFLSDALLPDTGTSDSMEVSGSDISDRIGQLFSEEPQISRETGPQDFPESSAAAEAPLSDELPTGPTLTGQDFDLSGLSFGDDLHGEDTPDAGFGSFDSSLSERAESSFAGVPVASGGDDVIELVNPGALQNMASELPAENVDLSGNDVSNRLEEIFSSGNTDLPADTSTDTAAPDFEGGFTAQQQQGFPDFNFGAPLSENVSGTISGAAPEPDFDLSIDAPSMTFDAVSDAVDTIGPDVSSDDMASPAAADGGFGTPASEFNEVAPDAAVDFSFDNNTLPLPDSDVEEIAAVPAPDGADGSGLVSGADISSRIDDLFDPALSNFSKETSINDVFATAAAAEEVPEGFDRLSDIPDLPVDFGTNTDVSTAEPDGNDGSTLVSGTDISSRIDDLFDPEPPNFTKDTSVNNGFATEGSAEGMPGGFDRSSETPQQLATSADPVFSGLESLTESATGGTSDLPFEPEFTESEFAETLQFDSALFERMLNPVEQELSPADQTPPAADVRSETIETMPVLDDLAADNDSGSVESGLMGRSPLEDFRHGRVETDSDALTEDTGFDRIIEPDLDRDTFQVTTERYRFDGPELVVDNDISSSVSTDDTPAFEFIPSDTDNDDPDLILEASHETGPIDITDLLADTPTANRLVSDHTEAIEPAPSGEDIAGQIDLLFPSDKAAVSPGSSGSEIDIPDNLHVDDILVAEPDSSTDDENDAAYIETMQMPREELAAAIARETAGFTEDDSGSDPILPSSDFPITAGSTVDGDKVDGPPVISGSDIQQRLDDIFPGSDLFSLSSDKALPPEDDQEDVLGSVSEFYTIAGDDASRGASVELPDTLAEVEFSFEPDTEPSSSGASVVPSVNETDDAGTAPAEVADDTANSAGNDDRFMPASPLAEVFPESSPFPENLPIDNRDEPFSMPDHVLTPTLANIYFQQGQAHLALRIYERLLHRDPDNEKLAERIADIRAAIERNELPEPRTNEPVKIELPRPKRTTSRASRKKPVDDDESTSRPLAGIHLKKQVKNAAKKARSRRH